MKKIYLFLKRNAFFSVNGKRTFYSENFLGITSFKQNRANKISEVNMDAYREKVIKICEDSELKALTHDVKKMCYLVETEDDFINFINLLEKNADVRYRPGNKVVFQSFSIGPEIMRMCHYMNKPLEAFLMVENPRTCHYFTNIKSFLILQDLLYSSCLYEEVCKTFKIMQEKQFCGEMFPIFNYVLYQAACYKKFTDASYDDVMESFKEFLVYCSKPNSIIIMYTLLFALMRDNTSIPVKYATGYNSAAINVKLAALIKTGDLTGALDHFNSIRNKSQIMESLVKLLSEMIKVKYVEPYNDITKKICAGKFSHKTFDELAADLVISLEKLKS